MFTLLRSTSLFLAVLLLLGAPAHGQSMSAMKVTAEAEFEKADAELNKVYKQSLSGLSPKGTATRLEGREKEVAALKEAQRAWITFRAKSAEAYGTSEEGGSLETLLAVRCSTTITRERTAQLKKMFQSGTEGY